MSRRVVFERLSEGSVPPSTGDTREVDAPSLAAIRLVFGVGSRPNAEPTTSDFKPVYTVSIPVFSLGGLDPDGVYEFDAGAQLELLRARANQRRWAVRLELELVQTAEAISAADLWVDVDWTDDALELVRLGPERGATTPGGGRTLIVASAPVEDIARARTLGGSFSVQLRDADPKAPDPATIASPVRTIRIDSSCYEFEDT